MEGRFINTTSIIEHENSKISLENSCRSPNTTMFCDSKLLASTSPLKRSRRSMQKRVVSLPISKEVDRYRSKCEIISNTPPSDSWVWRKYGQKPIKGSPYPRGYYRCSGSKGCPAKKQVQRSREDRNVLLVTYSCEHNHPWLATRSNQRSQSHNSTSSTITIVSTSSACKSEHEEEQDDYKQYPSPTNDICSPNSDKKGNEMNNVSDANEHALPLIVGAEFGWLSDFECTSVDTMLESQILTQVRLNNDTEIMNIDVFGGSIMHEEDQLLFGDLDELPECSMVFRSGMRNAEHHGVGRQRDSLLV